MSEQKTEPMETACLSGIAVSYAIDHDSWLFGKCCVLLSLLLLAANVLTSHATTEEMHAGVCTDCLLFNLIFECILLHAYFLCAVVTLSRNTVDACEDTHFHQTSVQYPGTVEHHARQAYLSLCSPSASNSAAHTLFNCAWELFG